MSGIYTHGSVVDQAAMSSLVSTNLFHEVFNGVSATHGYTSTSALFPSSNLKVLQVTYYDNYSFKTLTTGLDYINNDLTEQMSSEFLRVKGLVTGVKTNIVGTTNYLYTANYYDDNYRLIQAVAQNHKAGRNRSTYVFDFMGRLQKSKSTYLVNSKSHSIRDVLSYDHAGRVLSIKQSIDDAPELTVVKNEYNEIGELVTKKLHSNDGNNFKQQIDYRYNIRGWMTRINSADLNASDGGPKDFFGMEFGYNNDIGTGTFIPQYNGNISAEKWSANLGLGLSHLNEPTERAYTFTYDPMNRLKEASYAFKAGTWSSSQAYKEVMNYDLNGNIVTLSRSNGKGMKIDDLEHNYGVAGNKSNQLKSVNDYGVLTKGVRDRNTSGSDFIYDANGNVIQDKNKNIKEIRYNGLNLIDQIDKGSGEKVKYTYDADGMKLSEAIHSSGAQSLVKNIDYIGPLVYENDTLKFIIHDEGTVMIPKDQSGQEYQYQIKDHLNNTRLTFTTKEKTDIFKATLEDTGLADHNNPRVKEMMHFGNLFETEIRNVNQWLNHTSNSSGNAIYLDGSANKTIGPYTMIEVYPGDTIKMEVFAKFEKKSSHSTLPIVDLITALVSPVQAAANSFEGGSALSSTAFSEALGSLLLNRSSSTAVPAAYLNYILFDKDFKVVDMGFDRIDAAAGFNPSQEQTVAFDNLNLQRVIDRIGYIYVHVSNESPSTRVWMDDIKITYGMSPIVQFEDYYPFGLSQSETAMQHGDCEYEGMTTTKGTGLKDLGFRQYDAALGRFHSVDPLAELQIDQSTYQYVANNPVNQIDLLGLEPENNGEPGKSERNNKYKKRQRVSESQGYSRYKPKNRNDRQKNRNTSTAKNRTAKSSNTGTAESKKKTKDKDEKSTTKMVAPIKQSGSAATVHMLSYGPNPAREKSETRSDLHDTPTNQVNNSRQPRFENSVTPPLKNDETENSTPLVSQSAEMRERTTDEEQYRQYLIKHHSNNEARALYARMLVGRNSNYQSDRLKENLGASSNTSTSEDEILDDDLQNDPPTSTPAEALAIIPATLPQSPHFPKVKPEVFLAQLRERVSEGGHEGTNQGAGTNFCWAAAIAKQVYENDPKGMAEAMLGLYEDGEFSYDNNNGGMHVPAASQEARDAVGGGTFNNNQDKKEGKTINELDQMLFMELADNYKGYTNLGDVDPGYDPGDEEGLWAGCVLDKAVDVWKDFGLNIEVTGSDLGWANTGENKVNAAKESMKNHDLVLYVNSSKFKRDEGANWTATHYIHVESIEQVGSKYTITYWDYGATHEVTMTADQFFWSVYGMIEIPKTNE
ncbi:hypothetical protein DQQ10_18840 [Pseudochryseolinea flava]|uniref:Uncharacterized protein n=2 Tax=Pseudochryseolinea flava TaxID=2059302 RepID=A0A364XZF5_9BACT|nr:hypothetical protein DQQ10_18840 [Pseudochryseolinea flava]